MTSSMEDVRIVRFDICGLGFMLKVDQRRFPNGVDSFVARGGSVTVLPINAREITRNPLFTAWTKADLTPER